MVQETALTVRQPQQQGLTLSTLDEMVRFSELMFQSKVFKDLENAGQALVKMAFGMEHGIPPMTALGKVHFLQGKPTMPAELMAALVRGSREYDYQITEHTNTVCSIDFLHHGKVIGTSTYTMDDAKTAGLIDRNGSLWGKYPKNMLFARAMSNGCRWNCAHVIGGAYTPEELEGNVNEDGELIVESAKRPVITDVTPKNGNAHKPQEVPRDAEGMPVFDAQQAETAARESLLKEVLAMLSVNTKVGLPLKSKYEKEHSKLSEMSHDQLLVAKEEIRELLEISGVKVQRQTADTTMTGEPLPEGMQ